MKIIDLLNKIANGEENDLQTEFEFDDKIWSFYKLNHSEYCLDGWLLNQNITIIKHKEVVKEKKIPEKLDYCEENTFMNKKETTYLSSEERRLLDSNFKEICNKINSIIDYLKSKGE